ncbi:MAG: YheV family putative metal-binding protein [Pseudomonadales bacterium]
MARRRFIAGALCPECGDMDRLLLQVVCILDPSSSSDPDQNSSG